jgi:hypothetical protein
MILDRIDELKRGLGELEETQIRRCGDYSALINELNFIPSLKILPCKSPDS